MRIAPSERGDVDVEVVRAVIQIALLMIRIKPPIQTLQTLMSTPIRAIQAPKRPPITKATRSPKTVRGVGADVVPVADAARALRAKMKVKSKARKNQVTQAPWTTIWIQLMWSVMLTSS
jgi:hypothetical protein